MLFLYFFFIVSYPVIAKKQLFCQAVQCYRKSLKNFLFSLSCFYFCSPNIPIAMKRAICMRPNSTMVKKVTQNLLFFFSVSVFFVLQIFLSIYCNEETVMLCGRIVQRQQKLVKNFQILFSFLLFIFFKCS